jgi:hypothetical protein
MESLELPEAAAELHDTKVKVTVMRCFQRGKTEGKGSPRSKHKISGGMIVKVTLQAAGAEPQFSDTKIQAVIIEYSHRMRTREGLENRGWKTDSAQEPLKPFFTLRALVLNSAKLELQLIVAFGIGSIPH